MEELLGKDEDNRAQRPETGWRSHIDNPGERPRDRIAIANVLRQETARPA